MKTSLRHAAAPQWRSRPRVNDWPKRPPSGQHPRRRFLGLAAGAAALPIVVGRTSLKTCSCAGRSRLGRSASVAAGRASETSRRRLRGWGGRTRTAESVGIKIRRHCRGNLCRFGRNGAAETVRVRAAAFEFTRDRPRRQFRSSVLKPPKAAFVNSRSEIVNDACGRASMSDCCCRVRACDALRDVWRRDDVDEC
jgi:hypothetical protein